MTKIEELANLKDSFLAKGFARLNISLTSDESDAIENYLESRADNDHLGNIYDDVGQLRAVHGFERDFSPTLIARLEVVAKYLIECENVYVYQFRANIKHPSKGQRGGWQPHRDFDYWQLNDGTHRINIIPESTGDNEWQANFGENLKFTISTQSVDRCEEKSCLLGLAGDVFVMHPLTWHYSSPNRSDGIRTLLSIVFNDLDNLPVLSDGSSRRPDFIVEQPH